MEYGQLVIDHQTKETALVIYSLYDVPDNFTGIINIYGHYNWLVNGVLHREDGPAIEYKNGTKKWWLNGRYYYFQEEWFDKLTSEQQEKALWNMDNW